MKESASSRNSVSRPASGCSLMTVADCSALLPGSHAQQQRSTCMKLALRNGVMQLFWMPGGSHTWTKVAVARFRPHRRPRCPVLWVYGRVHTGINLPRRSLCHISFARGTFPENLSPCPNSLQTWRRLLPKARIGEERQPRRSWRRIAYPATSDLRRRRSLLRPV